MSDEGAPFRFNFNNSTAAEEEQPQRQEEPDYNEPAAEIHYRPSVRRPALPHVRGGRGMQPAADVALSSRKGCDMIPLLAPHLCFRKGAGPGLELESVKITEGLDLVKVRQTALALPWAAGWVCTAVTTAQSSKRWPHVRRGRRNAQYRGRCARFHVLTARAASRMRRPLCS